MPTPDAQTCPRCGKGLPPGALGGGLCPECLLRLGLESKTGAGEVIHTAGAGETSPPAAAPPSIEELAPKFPQFELLELVGRGGMGAVYKARQKGLDRLVALKVLPAQTGRDPSWSERFNREARALAKLAHPGIVGVHDFGQADGLAYFVMEYVDGSNLRAVIQARSANPAEALRIVMQICDALQYAHEEGIVHRDIKPENILIDKRGRVKIADFGLAKLLEGDRGGVTLTKTMQTMGTPHYMAPEQWEKPQQVDHRADIFSLGVVFYELLTGELPLGRFQPPSKKVQVDVRLDEVVLRALEKEPDLRYQQASQVRTEVDLAARRATQQDQASASPPRKGRIQRLLGRIKDVLDPYRKGRRILWGIELPHPAAPLLLLGFFLLCTWAALSAGGFMGFLLAAFSIWALAQLLGATKLG
jgi:serine/threonine protein kinase